MTRGKASLERSELLVQARAARAARDRGRGLLLVAIGLALLPLAVAINVVLDYQENLKSGHSSDLRGPAMYAIAASVAGLLLVRGRRLRAKGAEYALAHDERPPIVYLRSFESDRMQVAPSLGSRRRNRLRHTMVAFTYRQKTYEQVLADLLTDVGPFVTVGDPTETLPELGAARLYADDQEWHQTVDDLLSRGGPIILHTGDSPGLGWEVERIVALNQPERVILSLPLRGIRHKGSRRQLYAGFRSRFASVFPRGLPPEAGDTQYLYFDADWTPRRLEEPRRLTEPARGSLGEQRAAVLQKLAPQFKLMWAPLWVRLSVYLAVIPVVAVLLIVAIPDSSAPVAAPMPARSLANRLEPTVQQRLRILYDDNSIVVNSLTCVITSRTSARCQASVNDAHGPTQFPITVRLNPATGRAVLYTP